MEVRDMNKYDIVYAWYGLGGVTVSIAAPIAEVEGYGLKYFLVLFIGAVASVPLKIWTDKLLKGR
jgi:hypothetical protein